MTKEFDNFFDGFFNNNLPMKNPLTTDISEKDGVYTLSANLAGFDKDDIKVELNDGYLCITAEKAEKEEGEEGKYYLKESRSKVSRSYYVGKNFTREDYKRYRLFRNECFEELAELFSEKENHSREFFKNFIESKVNKYFE